MMENKNDQINSTELDSVSQIEEDMAKVWLQPFCPECESEQIYLAKRRKIYTRKVTMKPYCYCDNSDAKFAAKYEVLVHESEWDILDIDWLKYTPVETEIYAREDHEAVKITAYCPECSEYYVKTHCSANNFMWNNDWDCDWSDENLYNVSETPKLEIFCLECRSEPGIQCCFWL